MEPQSGTPVDQREQDRAMAPQRELQKVVMISQARVVVVGLERFVDMKKGACVGREPLEGRHRATVLESKPAFDPASELLRA